MSRLCSRSKAQAKQSLQAHPSGPTPPGSGQISTGRDLVPGPREAPPQHPGRRLCPLGAACHPRPCPGPALCPMSTAVAGAALLGTGLQQPEASDHQGCLSSQSSDFLHVPSVSILLLSPVTPPSPRVPCTTPCPSRLHAPHPVGSIWMQLRGLADTRVKQACFLSCSANPGLRALTSQAPRPHPTAGPAGPKPCVRNGPSPEGACCPHPRRPSGRSLWPQAQGLEFFLDTKSAKQQAAFLQVHALRNEGLSPAGVPRFRPQCDRLSSQGPRGALQQPQPDKQGLHQGLTAGPRPGLLCPTHFLEKGTVCPGRRGPGTARVHQAGLTFSFLQAKAAALFSASALRRPLATKVMGQGQSRVRVASLVLVPTV